MQRSVFKMCMIKKPVDLDPLHKYSDIPAPDSRFLLHASVAWIVYASWRATGIDRFCGELEDGQGLATDGLTEILPLALSLYLASTDISSQIHSTPEGFNVDLERTSTTDSSTSMVFGLLCS